MKNNLVIFIRWVEYITHLHRHLPLLHSLWSHPGPDWTPCSHTLTPPFIFLLTSLRHPHCRHLPNDTQLGKMLDIHICQHESDILLG